MKCACGFTGLPAVHDGLPPSRLCPKCLNQEPAKSGKFECEKRLTPPCDECNGIGSHPLPNVPNLPHRTWKCPECHIALPTPLKHDGVEDKDAGDLVCCMCGMRAKMEAEFTTECPGRGQNWSERTGNCLWG